VKVLAAFKRPLRHLKLTMGPVRGLGGPPKGRVLANAHLHVQPNSVEALLNRRSRSGTTRSALAKPKAWAQGLFLTRTGFQMQSIRASMKRFVAGFVLLAGATLLSSVAYAQNIEVRGSQRVDAETIRNYFSGSDPAKVNQAVKELYATGLFSSVRTENVGGRIIVHVTENQLINRVFFEGNSKLKSEIITSEIQSRSRGAYNPSTVQADVERILDLYRRGGRSDATVTSRIVDLPNGRVDVVFTINEGGKTGIRNIKFVGNNSFSESRLRGLMQTTEMNWLSFFKSSDVYDPDKLAADQELIRRFYLKNGYADFRITGADIVYAPEGKGYDVTITVDEGRQYKVGQINVESQLPDVKREDLLKAVRLSSGDTYNGDLVEKSVEAMTRVVARYGYAFASARPRAERVREAGLINVTFVIEEGPRVYVERVNVRGNTRTRDYVIRREIPLAEGDAYNRVLMDRAERRLNSLGFFKRVRITNEPGSSPDRVVINVDVEDQPTGAFSVSGGYSTLDGVIAEVAVSESNFLGRGQYAKLGVTGGRWTRGLDFSFTEPYFMDYRLAAGFDLFARQQRNNRFSIYDTTTVGGTVRFGVPLTDDLTFTPRYTLYGQEVKIPNTTDRPYNDCTNPIDNFTPGTGGTAPAADSIANGGPNCQTNGEVSLAMKEAAGTRIVSMVGYGFIYSTIDNPKNPTQGISASFRQDIAGAGGDARFLRSTADFRYYMPLWDDIVGFFRLQGGHIAAFGGDSLLITDHFNLGPALVRGFAPGGIGPRDLNSTVNGRSASLGGNKYVSATAEVQFPLFGTPKELGLKGAVFADAGTLFGYEGRTNLVTYAGYAAGTSCALAVGGAGTNPPWKQSGCLDVHDKNTLRSSVGASLLWASPFGPVRFDYAHVLSRDSRDVGQAFRFTGGGTF